MLDKRERLEGLVNPILTELLPECLSETGRKIATGWAINAADRALSSVLSCGGACVDCESIGRLVNAGSEVRVCNLLEQSGQRVYRQPERKARRLLIGFDESGAFY